MSKKKIKAEPVQTLAPDDTGRVQTSETETVIKLNTSAKNKKTYFYKVDSEVLQLIENGSPDSIRQGIIKIRKNESEYTENEKVLIQVATDIMKIAYPSEKISWETYEITEDNPYTGAINSVRNGIFDTSTGNVDVLTSILPALYLINTKPSAEMEPYCETAVKLAAEYNPDSVLVNYISGIFYSYKQDFAVAENNFKNAYEQASDNKEIALEYAKVLNQNGKVSDAETILANIALQDPNNIQVLKQNAYIAFNKKDYTLAEEYVARVLQQTPNNLEFVLFRAKILVEKNDYIHAVSLLDMYARQDDSSLEYLLLRTRVQLDWSKNITGATDTIEKALTLYNGSEEALLLAAKISSLTDSPVAGKYSDELASMVLQKNPENFDALYYSLNGLVQRENWNEAYQVSSKLVSSNSCPANVILAHVNVCLKLGKTAEALEKASAMYKDAPEDETALQAYILASTEVMSQGEAVKLIDSLLTTNSPKIKSYLYYRRSFLQISEENALADLRSSLISNPRNSDSLFRMYEIYFQKQEYRKAQYYLRQVVSINPNDNSVRKLNEALTQLIQ